MKGLDGSMRIDIRLAKDKDIGGIIKLLRQIADLHHTLRPDIFRKGSQKYSWGDLEAIISDKSRPVIVAVDGKGSILGYCFLFTLRHAPNAVLKDFSSLFIDDLCVDERFRNQGIGKKLFEAAKAHAKQIKAYNMYLNVWEANEGAIEFYKSMGFFTQRRRMEMIL